MLSIAAAFVTLFSLVYVARRRPPPTAAWTTYASKPRDAINQHSKSACDTTSLDPYTFQPSFRLGNFGFSWRLPFLVYGNYNGFLYSARRFYFRWSFLCRRRDTCKLLWDDSRAVDNLIALIDDPDCGRPVDAIDAACMIHDLSFYVYFATPPKSAMDREAATQRSQLIGNLITRGFLVTAWRCVFVARNISLVGRIVALISMGMLSIAYLLPINWEPTTDALTAKQRNALHGHIHAARELLDTHNFIDTRDLYGTMEKMVA